MAIQSVLSSTLMNRFVREDSQIGRRRLSLIFCYIPATLLGILSNLLGFSGEQPPIFNYTHIGFIAVCATILALYIARKISVKACLIALTLAGQAMVSTEMLWLSANPNEYRMMLIMADTALLGMNAMASVAGYLKSNTIALGVISILTYSACTLISKDAYLGKFMIVFAISFTFIGIIGLLSAKATERLECENARLRREESDLLHILRIKKSEIQVYLALASKENSAQSTSDMLDLLDKKARHNLLVNVEDYLKSRDTDLKLIDKAFPELTPSEKEICQLILQGRKLGDICAALGKTETNVNSQRANMRRKLALRPSDNLLEALRQRLSEYQPAGK